MFQEPGTIQGMGYSNEQNRSYLNLSSSKMAILTIVVFKTMAIIIITTMQVTGSVLNILYASPHYFSENLVR